MPTPSSLPTFYLGLDLGQASDFSALVVLETADEAPPRTYAGRHLQRWALHTSYVSIVRDVATLTKHLARQTDGRTSWLAVDGTGVGRAVVDLLRMESMPRVHLIPMTITSGLQESYDNGFWSVPKKNLVSITQVALQTGRLKIASALPEAATLQHELMNFEMKITTSGHDTYGAWRQGSHDDLVLGLSVALWVGERVWPTWEPIGT
jgi:hypothetical protein